MSLGAFRTTLLLGSEEWVDEQLAITASYERRLDARWTLTFSAGGVPSGRLTRGEEVYAVGGGGVAAASASFLAFDQGRLTPFLIVSGSFSATAMAAQPSSAYVAVDVRVAASAGYTFFGRLTPYVAVRAFGGPVFWAGRVGGDATHVQLGGGLAALLPDGLDAFLEVIPVGEQRISGGIGASF